MGIRTAQSSASATAGDPAQASAGKPPYLGFGLGLRTQHYTDILDGDPRVDWFEVISENFMVPGGQPLAILDRIAARYPVVMHGVSLSIASTAPFDEDYLDGLVALAKRVQPKWISDHLCWTGVHGVNLHDLLLTFPGFNGGNAFSGGYLQFDTSSGTSTTVRVDASGGANSYVTLVTLTGALLQQADTTNYVL